MSKIIYQTPKEEIKAEPDVYLKIGEEKGYFICDGSKIKYTAVNKGYNFNDPEEKVRTEFYLDLLEKYQYPAKELIWTKFVRNSRSLERKRKTKLFLLFLEVITKFDILSQND